MIAGGHGDENPNKNWMNSKGFFVFYLIFVTFFHLILLSIFSTPFAWTLTLQCHNLAHLYFLHIIKGTPWVSTNSNEHMRETHWEQIDSGQQWSQQRKTLIALPIILFLLTCLYTSNDEFHFIINFISLVICLIPKFPFFHHRRIFGINKY